MILCPFCAYLNGLSEWKPKLESYYHEHDSIIPYGFIYLDDSGGLMTNDFKIYPRNSSDMFDKTELQIIDQETIKRLSFLKNKIVCDICIMDMYLLEKCIVLKQLDEKEKLFRIFMRNQKA